eukprot:NODE_91_length_21779_cov_0.171356.p9 type:complete len:306 gc:universal NODE_91_length_21779_cov_0.171356:16242-15325(-)
MADKYILVKDKRVRKYSLVSRILMTSVLVMVMLIVRFSIFEASVPRSKSDFNTTQNEIFIVIPSAPLYSENRDAIRKTWKLDLHPNMRLNFYVGVLHLNVTILEDLKNEMEENGDMVLLSDFKDAYNDLTSKMVHIYRHITLHETGIKWVFKTDTDVWLNINKLQTNLNITAHQTAVGSEISNSPVYRTGVYANTKYKNTFYPTYFSGAGYAISFDVIEWIVDQYINGWLEPISNEDAAFGVWISGTPVKLIKLDICDNRMNRSSNRKFFKKCKRDHLLIHYLNMRSIFQADINYKICGNACGCR